jgi:hypothetical protein
MATDKTVAKLKRDMTSVKTHLSKLEAWNRTIVANTLRRLKRQRAVTGPTVTDPPKPPRP